MHGALPTTRKLLLLILSDGAAGSRPGSLILNTCGKQTEHASGAVRGRDRAFTGGAAVMPVSSGFWEFISPGCFERERVGCSLSSDSHVLTHLVHLL